MSQIAHCGWKIDPEGLQIRVLMDRCASKKANYAQGRYLLKDPKLIEEEWLPRYQQSNYPLRIVLASGTHSDNGPGIPELAPKCADDIIQYNARPEPRAKLVNATPPQFLQQIDNAEVQRHFMPGMSGDFGQSWDMWPVTMADFAMRMRSVSARSSLPSHCSSWWRTAILRLSQAQSKFTAARNGI